MTFPEKKKSVFRKFGALLTTLIVVALGLYVVGSYLPLEVREKASRAEWAKSVPPWLVNLALFRGTTAYEAVSLERGKPFVMEFSSSKPFRLAGVLTLGSPAAENMTITASLLQGKAKTSTSEVTCPRGATEMALYGEVFPAGEYMVQLEVTSVMEQTKTPADLEISVRY